MNEVQMIPVAAISPDALARDRQALAPDALEELKQSILKHGLRQPIEVFAMEPEGGFDYALVSGYRRLAAFRAIAAESGGMLCSAIPAFVRQPASITAAMAVMVEENAIRAEVSPWEQAMVAVRARDDGHFETVDAAIDALYATLHRDRRRRLRAIAHLVEEMEGLLTAPETYSQSRLLRLAAATTRGMGEVIRHALRETRQKDPEVQWSLLLPIIAEAEDPNIPAPRTDAQGRTRPRRVFTAPLHALRIRRQQSREGWSLHFTGRDASGDFIDTVFDHIEAMFSPA